MPAGYDRAVRELVIDGRRIADDTPCFVIAEIGHNHQGSVERARELIHSAKEAGVDAVKLQKRDNRRLYTSALYDSPYDNENSFGPTYGAHREALELDRDAYVGLRDEARSLGLVFFATAFDEPSADLLAELEVPAFKIASGDLTNTPLLRHVAALGRPLVVSTGGATIEDVDRAVDAITGAGGTLCLLQCTAAYPVAVEDLNLGVIATMRERYPELVIEVSDHQDGIAMAPVAYMLGARVLEKHFTLSHTAKGTDHAFSLMPEGMRELVRDLRRVPIAIGDGIKRPLPSETETAREDGEEARRGASARGGARPGRGGSRRRGRRPTRSSALLAGRSARTPACARARGRRDDPRRRRRPHGIRRRDPVTQPPREELRALGRPGASSCRWTPGP